MFLSGLDLLQACKNSGKPIWTIVMSQEASSQNISEAALLKESKNIWHVMKKSAKKGLSEPLQSLSGMTGGNAFLLHEYAEKDTSYMGKSMLKAMARAMSTSETNAAMGKIVAAPTAGASGILPGTLLTLQEEKKLSDDEIVQALFTASAIGQIIALKSSVAGAVGGCQAECGSAAAMAAAAAVELSPLGSPEKALEAASFALINIMGLVCDPVAGLVEFPCTLRNASGVINALLSADMALAGIKSLIPFDEVVDAMDQVGQSMSPTLKETALGGLATTPSGCLLKEKYMPDLD